MKTLPSKPPTIRLTVAGTLRQEFVGRTLCDPTPDVDPDPFVLQFLRAAARLSAPGWVDSDERFGETCRWSRGELGGEDIREGLVRIGTLRHCINIRQHYLQPEQELFPTARREIRWYSVTGLPVRRHLSVDVDREWLAGTLRMAEVTLFATVPKAILAKVVAEFLEAFERT